MNWQKTIPAVVLVNIILIGTWPKRSEPLLVRLHDSVWPERSCGYGTCARTYLTCAPSQMEKSFVIEPKGEFP